MLAKEEIERGLNTRLIGRKTFVFETIDSTNACTKTLGDAGMEEGAVVLAEFQTTGRGRHGRSWLAQPGQNLLFSVLLRPAIPKDLSGLLTLYASVAVARAVESMTGCAIECKWPNDLLLNGKKFCGILLENVFQQGELSYSVIGVGINVNQMEFPSELELRATSLARECRSTYDRAHLLQLILHEMDSLYDDVRRGKLESVSKEWSARCTMFGQEVSVEQHHTIISGVAVKLHYDGGLVLDTPSGTTTIYAGDVTIVG